MSNIGHLVGKGSFDLLGLVPDLSDLDQDPLNGLLSDKLRTGAWYLSPSVLLGLVAVHGLDLKHPAEHILAGVLKREVVQGLLVDIGGLQLLSCTKQRPGRFREKHRALLNPEPSCPSPDQ